METQDIWNNANDAQALNKEKAALEMLVKNVLDIEEKISETFDVIEIAQELDAEDIWQEAVLNIEQLKISFKDLEFMVCLIIQWILEMHF